MRFNFFDSFKNLFADALELYDNASYNSCYESNSINPR